MAFDEYLADRVRTLLRKRHVAFEEKRMMGGLCLMVDGKMCLGILNDRLMVRLDPAIYDESLQRLGCVPMDFTGRPMRGFVFVNPEGILDDPMLSSWIDSALDFNPKANASKSKRKRDDATDQQPRKPTSQKSKTRRPSRESHEHP